MKNILIIFISLLIFSCDDNIPDYKPAFNIVRLLRNDFEADKIELYESDTIRYIQEQELYDSDSLNLIFSCNTLNTCIREFTCKSDLNEYDTIFITSPVKATIDTNGYVTRSSKNNIIEHCFKLPTIKEGEPSPRVIELNYNCIDENFKSYTKKIFLEYFISNKFKIIPYCHMYYSKKQALNLVTGKVCKIDEMIGKEEQIHIVKGDNDNFYSPDDPALINSDFYPENFDKSKLNHTKFKWNWNLNYSNLKDSDIKNIDIQQPEIIDRFYDDDLIAFETTDNIKGFVRIYNLRRYNLKYLDFN